MHWEGRNLFTCQQECLIHTIECGERENSVKILEERKVRHRKLFAIKLNDVAMNKIVKRQIGESDVRFPTGEKL